LLLGAFFHAALLFLGAWPRERLAVTVAATDQDDQRLYMSPGVGSNYGPCVDVWAPGSAIVSADHANDTAVMLRSGTSQAVPFVAGCIALYLQNATGAWTVTTTDVSPAERRQCG
jgi:subtilisin family serine protease